jgi:hypothetical protein
LQIILAVLQAIIVIALWVTVPFLVPFLLYHLPLAISAVIFVLPLAVVGFSVSVCCLIVWAHIIKRLLSSQPLDFERIDK